jgi:hypothetical protein
VKDDFNPYAPPIDVPEERAPARRGGGGSGGHGVWRENGQAVMAREGAELPDRCVICNAPTEYKLRKTFLWHPPGYYALILAGWLFYLIAILFVRKSATVELGLCEQHLTRRKNGLIITWAGLAIGLVVLIAGLSATSPALILFGVVVLLVCLAVGGSMARVASAARIDDSYLWLKAGEPFVSSLPRSPDEEPLPRPTKKKRRYKRIVERSAGE